MGFQQEEISEAELWDRAVEGAQAFAHGVKQLASISEDLKPYAQAPRLSASKSHDKQKMGESYAAVAALLKEVAVVCRGHSAMTKDFDIPKKAAKLLRTVESLQSVLWRNVLSPVLLKSELDQVRSDILELSASVDGCVAYVRSLLDPTARPPSELPDEVDWSELASYLEHFPTKPTDSSFVAIRTAPLLVTFNREVSDRELQNKGIPFSRPVQGYTVLEEQTILCVHRETVTARKLNLEGVVGLTLKKIAKDPFVLMCDASAVHKKRPGWVYYWVGSESYLSALGGKLSGRLFATSFSFPA